MSEKLHTCVCVTCSKVRLRGGQEGMYLSSHLSLLPKQISTLGRVVQKTKKAQTPCCSRWKLHVLSSNLSSPAEVTEVASINLVVSEQSFQNSQPPAMLCLIVHLQMSSCFFKCQRGLKCPESPPAGLGYRVPPTARLCYNLWRG